MAEDKVKEHLDVQKQVSLYLFMANDMIGEHSSCTAAEVATLLQEEHHFNKQQYDPVLEVLEQISTFIHSEAAVQGHKNMQAAIDWKIADLRRQYEGLAFKEVF